MKRALALLFLLIATPACASGPALLPTEIIRAEGKPMALVLEVAADEPARNYGLMNRNTLKPHDGMVFLFPDAQPQRFWMKNTRIPLDMLFIDTRHRIVFIGHGVPMDRTPVGPKDIPIATVIEIDGGRAARDGIAIGDEVRYDAKILSQQLVR